MPIPDRTNDIQPPARGTHLTCQCGKLMIPRVDFSQQHQGHCTWCWWCGGCGHVVEGGKWHPQTADEGLQQAWEQANAQAEARAAQPGREIKLDCKHENKTVADGGWTCNDCGRVGTIAAFADHMRAMPPSERRSWDAANAAGKLEFWGFTKDQHDAWKKFNPTAAELAAEIELFTAQHSDAGPDEVAAAILAQRPGMETKLLNILVGAHVEARGTQEDVATHA